jgi:hypothetical protein
MKNPKSRSIRIADLEVTIETTTKRQYDGTITLTVAGTCGKSTFVATTMSPPNSRATPEQIEKSLDEFCTNIAREVARREKNRRLAKELT